MKKEDIKMWGEQLNSIEEQVEHLESGKALCKEIDDGVVCLVKTRGIFGFREVFFVDYENMEVFCDLYLDSESLMKMTPEQVERIDGENFDFNERGYRTGTLISLMEDHLGEYPELKGVYRKFEKEYKYWENVKLFESM